MRNYEDMAKREREPQNDIRCPYYKRMYGGRKNQWVVLECEGIHEGSRRLRQVFNSRRTRERVIETFCCSEFNECPVAKAIYENKYEDD